MSKGDNFANGALVTRAGNAKKSSEELNGISESAQEQHEMELQALFDQLELEEGEEVQFPYLVRGAELYCNCGTHKRRLNLPICHGVYTNGKPMPKRRESGEQIMVCQSRGQDQGFFYRRGGHG